MNILDDVTIIIPVYNAEKYLSRCIDSILNQSYKSIQILLIDDCSNDSSNKIIQDYCSRYSSITFLRNEQRMGVAKTRNVGLSAVKTKYVGFLDSDDWLDLNCINKAVNLFLEDSAIEIAVWEIKTAQNHENVCFRYKYGNSNVIEGKTALKLLAHTYHNEFFLSPLLGAKLFKRSIIEENHLCFPESVYEDDYFCFLAFMYAKKVALIVDSALYYYQHSTSLTHHFTNQNVTDFYTTFISLYNVIKDSNTPETISSFYHYFKKSLNSMLNQLDVCIQNQYDYQFLKSLICKKFYENIDVEEYYKHCDQLNI